jgi:phosphatidylserine/phosphatidylglycerophosphate/cardiolipin synthase-like enzyme
MSRSAVRVALLAALASTGLACPAQQSEVVRPPAPPQPLGELTLREAYDRVSAQSGPTGVELLSESARAWSARWELLSKAEKRVDAAYYIVNDDIFGLAFLGLLYERAAAGVEVRLLVDAFGSAAFLLPLGGRDYLQEIANTGRGDIHVYNAFHRRLADFLGGTRAVFAVASTHDKILVVDRQAAITGGRNIAREYFTKVAEYPLAFEDADVLVDGRVAVRQLEQAFDREFEAWVKEHVHQDPLNVKPRSNHLRMLARAMDAWLRWPDDDLRSDSELLLALEAKALSGFEALPRQQEREEVRPYLRELLRYRSLRGTLPAPPVSRYDVEARVEHTSSRARGVDESLNDGLKGALAGARRDILIQSPYLILTVDLLAAFEEVSRRGVRVTLVTNSPASSDNPASQSLFYESWPELMARIPTLRVFAVTSKRMMHAKRVVIDDDLVLIGSYNFDPLSAAMNSEALAFVWSRAFAARNRMEIERRAAHADIAEYTIEREDDGTPRRYPAGHARAGQVVVGFGPEDHVPPATLQELAVIRAQMASIEDLFDFDVVYW